MEELKEIYIIQKMEQMRVFRDTQCLRILSRLVQETLSVAQLCAEFGETRETVYSQVRDLESVGFIQRVGQQQAGQRSELSYRAVAKQFLLAPSLTSSASGKEASGTVQELFDLLNREALETLHRAEKRTDETLAITRKVVWLPESLLREVEKHMLAVLAGLGKPRGLEGEREWAINLIAYTMPTATPADTAKQNKPYTEKASPKQEAGKSRFVFTNEYPQLENSSSAPADSEIGRRRFVFAMERTTFTRQDLEDVLAAGERMDIFALGTCIFADDISSELVERAVIAFCHRGELQASSQVRQVLASRSSS